MPIIIEGQEYQDGVHYEFARNPLIPDALKKKYENALEINANSRSGDFQSRFLASNVPNTSGITTEDMTAAGMALEASRKPADALNPSAGTQVADTNIDAVRAPYGVMAPIEIPEGSLQGQGFGKPKEAKTEDTSPVVFKTASPLVNITEDDINRGIEVGMGVGPLSFAGVRSKMFNRNALAEAQILEKQGMDADGIFAKTGMFRGVDKRWRYEISDHNATVNQEALRYDAKHGEGASTASLGDFYNHPELYKAYPQLKDVKIIEDLNFKGIAEAGNDYIKFNPENIKGNSAGWSLKDILGHEVQHLIQNVEGFAKGGAPLKIANEVGVADPYVLKYQLSPEKVGKIREGIQYIINKAREGKASDSELDSLTYFNKVLETHENYISAANKQAMEHYWNLAGEAEARNVTNRMGLHPDFARTLHPDWTQDVAPAGQIITKEPVGTSAYGIVDPKTGLHVKPQADVSNFRRGANDNEIINTPEPTRVSEDTGNKWKKYIRLNELQVEQSILLQKQLEQPWNDIEKAQFNKLKREYDLLRKDLN